MKFQNIAKNLSFADNAEVFYLNLQPDSKK